MNNSQHSLIMQWIAANPQWRAFLDDPNEDGPDACWDAFVRWTDERTKNQKDS